jgi:ATP-dependent DNA helicase DinG
LVSASFSENLVPSGFTVILIQDTPLRQRMSAILAAEFGSRIQGERTDASEVLVSGWEFWLTHRHHLPPPALMIITTLPFPSVEHPLVAARVNAYKHHRKDWFQNFLLPQALRDLQRAVAPLRGQSGFLALLDTRILHRSYGQQILNILSPYLTHSTLYSEH